MDYTRKELIADMAMHNDLEGKASAERVLDHLIELITDTVKSGGSVTLGQSFGVFKPFAQAAKTGVAMGVEYSTPAKTVVKFKPSKQLREAVAGK